MGEQPHYLAVIVSYLNLSLFHIHTISLSADAQQISEQMCKKLPAFNQYGLTTEAETLRHIVTVINTFTTISDSM